MPLVFVLTGVNVHYSKTFDELLDYVRLFRASEVGPANDLPSPMPTEPTSPSMPPDVPTTRHQGPHCTTRRRIGQKLGRARCVIKRRFAWLNRFRRLSIR